MNVGTPRYKRGTMNTHALKLSPLPLYVYFTELCPSGLCKAFKTHLELREGILKGCNRIRIPGIIWSVVGLGCLLQSDQVRFFSFHGAYSLTKTIQVYFGFLAELETRGEHYKMLHTGLNWANLVWMLCKYTYVDLWVPWHPSETFVLLVTSPKQLIRSYKGQNNSLCWHWEPLHNSKRLTSSPCHENKQG